MVKLEKISVFTGKRNTMEFPDGIEARIAAWKRPGSRQMVQEAFPDLTADQREFLLSGATPEEWDEATREDDDESTA